MCEKRARKKARRSWVDGSNSFLLATIGAITPAFGYLMGMRGRGSESTASMLSDKKRDSILWEKSGSRNARVGRVCSAPRIQSGMRLCM